MLKILFIVKIGCQMCGAFQRQVGFLQRKDQKLSLQLPSSQKHIRFISVYLEGQQSAYHITVQYRNNNKKGFDLVFTSRSQVYCKCMMELPKVPSILLDVQSHLYCDRILIV